VCAHSRPPDHPRGSDYSGGNINGNNKNTLLVYPFNDSPVNAQDLSIETRSENRINDGVRRGKTPQRPGIPDFGYPHRSVVSTCHTQEDFQVYARVSSNVSTFRKKEDMCQNTPVRQMPRNHKTVPPVIPFATADKNPLSGKTPGHVFHPFHHGAPRIFHQHETGNPVRFNGGSIAPLHLPGGQKGNHLEKP
jgi:hypothetical protein